MEKNINQKLIDDILQHSQKVDKELHRKISEFAEIYNEQEKQNEKLVKENSFFLKKWDKRNILNHEKKDKIIEQQSRMAAMGEMIDAVAHQWKQPLNAISMMIDMLRDDFKNNKLDDEYINDLEQTTQMQISHMLSTLSEFRNFLRPSTKNENFNIHSLLQTVQVLMKDELIAQNLLINIDVDSEVKIYGNKNEFKHLFINIINNSIDAFNERQILSREFYVRCYKIDKKVFIEIEDNAGGIAMDIIDHVFEANVTTKAHGKGTGIGLYMSNQIVNKYNGEISVKNTDDGVLFTITLQESAI